MLVELISLKEPSAGIAPAPLGCFVVVIGCYLTVMVAPGCFTVMVLTNTP
jgi:hypothetical protein